MKKLYAGLLLIVMLMAGCVSVIDDDEAIYTITYEKNSSEAAGTMDEQYLNGGTSARLNPCQFTLNGAVFTGWAFSPQGDIVWQDEAAITMYSSNITLYAQWGGNSCTVTYDSCGGSEVAPGTAEQGKTVAQPADPVWGHRIFRGWYTGTNYITRWNFAADTVTGDITLYAKWFDDRALVTVPGGKFVQQSTTGSNFQHTVSGFAIGKYEVTYNLWYTVRQWALNHGYTFANPGKQGKDGTAGAAPGSGKMEPVQEINWRDALVWCNAYSEMSGYTPVYYSDSGFFSQIKTATADNEIDTTAGSCDNPYVKWSADGFRLPTEGEWQYAAAYRDGTSWTPADYASGAAADYSDQSATGAVAWTTDNSGSTTHDVGTRNPNQLGIHDMSGNAGEWCWDWSSLQYPDSAQTNYRGGATGSNRVWRGGNYHYAPSILAVGQRSTKSPNSSAMPLIGLRVVRSVQ